MQLVHTDVAADLYFLGRRLRLSSRRAAVSSTFASGGGSASQADLPSSLSHARLCEPVQILRGPLFRTEKDADCAQQNCETPRAIMRRAQC